MKDLINKTFGRLTVIEYAGLNKHKVCLWKCICECGETKVIISQSLINGNTKSCGCISKNKFKDNPEHMHGRYVVPTKCGIYKITSPLNEVYIGSSRVIYKRWLRHRECNKKTKLHESIRKHGWRNHIFEISHELPLDISDNILINYEQFYIDLYRNSNNKMLNVKDAGSSAKFPEESKKLMSLVRKKEYKLMLNGELITFIGLKEYSIKNNLGQRQLSDLYNNNGHYGKKNYYKGYLRIN